MMNAKLLLADKLPPRVVQIGATQSDAERRKQLSRQAGVAEHRIEIIVGRSMRAIRPVQSASQWLTDHPDRRVQILCSEFSTFGLRRMIDRNLAAELSQRISIQPLPDRRYSVKNWWRSRLGQRDVFQAYLGLTRSVLGLYPPEPPAYLSPDEYEQAFLRSITTSRVLETPREPWRPECESKNRPPTGSFSCRLADELKQLVNQDRRPGKTVLLKKS